MKFSEPVRLLEKNGFHLVKQKGSIQYYAKDGCDNVVRVDFHGAKEIPAGTCRSILKAAGIDQEGDLMIELPYSLVIEATDEPDFFNFFSPDLPGFSGIAHSVEGAIYHAKAGMAEHIAVLSETNRPVPPRTQVPTILIQNAQYLEQAA